MKLIRIDVERLALPLATIDVRRACAYPVRISGVPREVSNLQITVISVEGNAFNPIPASIDAEGNWKVKLPPMMFPAVGCCHYEVWGLDADGDKFALGRGCIAVRPFESGDMTPVSPTGRQIVTAIPDRSGRLHNVVAEEVDGEYTWVIED